MSESFFTTDDHDWFSPTTHCRGPWNVDHCHAGPPTGLIARAVEILLPQQRLTRLTVNLLRPVPYAGFRISAEIVRTGRIVSTSAATLINEDNKPCVSATAMHMTTQPKHALPTLEETTHNLSDAAPGQFPMSQTLHNEPAFNGSGVEVMYPPGQSHLPGPTVSWMRTVPLLADETPSPFQRICPLADCGNAFSRNAEPQQVNFMNPDLTLLLHRDPEGEWLGSDAQSHWQNNGIGMADARLFDQHGSVGRALQTLLLQPVIA